MKSSLNNQSVESSGKIEYDLFIEDADLVPISKTLQFKSSIFMEEDEL
jgi:hypothetical protein